MKLFHPVSKTEQIICKGSALMIDKNANIQRLTQLTINDLQEAFQRCGRSSEGLILAAMVKVRAIHDLLLNSECPAGNGNADSYRQAA